jgi:cold shock protein
MTEQRIENRGVVRKLKDGYGFIAGYDGLDYFFHWTAMQQNTKNFRELAVGDRVTFESLAGPKGPRAIEIHVTSSGTVNGTAEKESASSSSG